MLLIIMSDKIKDFMDYAELSSKGTETYVFDINPSDVRIIGEGTATKSGNPCLALETSTGVRYRIGAMGLLNSMIKAFGKDNPILFHNLDNGKVQYNESEEFSIRAKDGTTTVTEAGYKPEDNVVKLTEEQEKKLAEDKEAARKLLAGG